MLATAVAFELQLHPIPADGILHQAQAIWPIETAMEAFQWYYEWQQTTPIHLETEYVLTTVPGVGQVAAVSITNWDPENTTSVTEAFEVRYLLLLLTIVISVTIILTVVNIVVIIVTVVIIIVTIVITVVTIVTAVVVIITASSSLPSSSTQHSPSSSCSSFSSSLSSSSPPLASGFVQQHW